MKSTPSTGNKRVLNSQRKSSIDEEENDEERKSLNLSNRNVEEVLENLQDAEDELFERGDE
jgi:hypothetical protein